MRGVLVRFGSHVEGFNTEQNKARAQGKMLGGTKYKSSSIALRNTHRQHTHTYTHTRTLAGKTFKRASANFILEPLHNHIKEAVVYTD